MNGKKEEKNYTKKQRMIKINNMISGIIYKYTSPSGKVYIGQTMNEDRRKHCFMNAKIYAGYAINMARLKYGPENFKYEVLMEYNTNNIDLLRKILNIFEVSYIIKFKSNDIKYGYNITTGGDLNTAGVKYTDEAREHCSIAQKKRFINKNNHPLYGRHHSEETKKKISEKAKGRKMSQNTKDAIYNATRKEVLQYDLYGNLICEFKSIAEAANILNISRSGIGNCCCKRQNTSHGYIFKYKEVSK